MMHLAAADPEELEPDEPGSESSGTGPAGPDDDPGAELPEPVAGDPESMAAGVVEDEDLDLDLDDEEFDEEGEESDEEGDGEAGAKPKEPAKKRKKDEDPDAELNWDKEKVASLDELRAAMGWAFEGEDVEEALLDKFAAHARMVLEGNKRMNLTAILKPKEVAAKHYLDSYRLLVHAPLMGVSFFASKVLDLGTGAGFPGMPLALAEPNASITLLDSTKKRVDFNQECVTELGIKNAHTEWVRAEEWLARNEVDTIVMRAISSVRENVRLLRKVRHSHKNLVMIKGKSWSREVRAAEREAERLGFRLASYAEHELPDELGKSCILVYEAPGGRGL